MSEVMGKTPFSETRVAMAANEIMEDRIIDAIKHCQDMTTVEGKPCEVTINVKITPNRTRSQFMFEVSGKTKFSPRESAESELYTRIDDNGRVEYIQFDPENQLPFEN